MLLIILKDTKNKYLIASDANFRFYHINYTFLIIITHKLCKVKVTSYMLMSSSPFLLSHFGQIVCTYYCVLVIRHKLQMTCVHFKIICKISSFDFSGDLLQFLIELNVNILLCIFSIMKW